MTIFAMRILLVEDNLQLSSWLGRLLEGRNYVVDRVFDASEADAAAASFRYDLIILDLGLPDQSGLEVLQGLRRRGDRTAVLILTASDGLAARVEGLDCGADDYLSKPFEVEELEARIRALLRRSQGHVESVIRFGQLSFDTTTRLFAIGGEHLALTPRERAVLETLIHRAGGVVSKEVIAETIFGFNEDSSPAAIEIYVHRLRRKLKGANLEIATLRGIGYALRGSDADRV